MLPEWHRQRDIRQIFRIEMSQVNIIGNFLISNPAKNAAAGARRRQSQCRSENSCSDDTDSFHLFPPLPLLSPDVDFIRRRLKYKQIFYMKYKTAAVGRRFYA